MKILHLIDNMSIGGAPIVLYTTIKELKKKHPKTKHVIGYIHDGPYRKKFEDLGVETKKLHLLIPRYDPFLLPQLLMMIWREKPNVIHAALTYSWLHGRLAGWLTRTPVVCAIHGDVTHNGRFPLLCLRLMGHLAQQYVTITQQARKTLLENQNRFVNPAHTTVIYNGIDVPTIRTRAAETPCTRAMLNLEQNDFVIGSIGRLSAEKSPTVLVRSAAILIARLRTTLPATNIRLCFIGDGPEKKAIETLAVTLGITEHIRFAPGTMNPFPYYPLFDTFVLSSQTEGGTALVLLEAMAFGVPVITTHDRDAHETIIDGVDGYFVPVNDTAALADRLHTLACDEKTRYTIGNTGKQLVEQKYSADIMAEQYLAVFKSAAHSRENQN